MTPTWQGTIPIYINNFNRLTYLQGMVEYLRPLPGTRTVIIDNNSTYPPLLEWYKRKCPCQVIYLDDNHGHHAPWSQGIVQCGEAGYYEHKTQWGSDWYVVTDPDLDLTGVPTDLIDVLIQGMTLWSRHLKCGLSLEIDDVPPWAKERCEKNERHFWAEPLDARYFRAPTDTTFAIYRATVGAAHATRIEPCVRTNRPYTAKHIPWYHDVKNLSEEDAYYYQHCGKSATWRP